MIGSLVLGFVPFGGVLNGDSLHGWTEQPNQSNNGWGGQSLGPSQWTKEVINSGIWNEQPPNDVDTIKSVSD